MRFSKPCSIRLIATLTICLNLGLIGKVLAQEKSCSGASCNDKDPVEYNCDSDAYVVEEVNQTIYRWQDSLQPREIVVKHIYSELCNANWTKAYIPDDTYLFIREQTLVNGSQPIHGLFQAQGRRYFWAYSNMSNGSVVNQACVSIPVGQLFGHNFYDQYCTNFN
jgi:hypothetical protein